MGLFRDRRGRTARLALVGLLAGAVWAGPASVATRLTAPAVSAAVPVDVLSVGKTHSCAIYGPTGVLSCWGANDVRQSTPPDTFGPGDELIPVGLVDVSVGEDNSSCGITTDEQLLCWGAWSSNGDTPPGSFLDLGVGDGHGCAISTTREIACWGADTDGQLGAPTGLFEQIDAGDKFSCAVAVDESISCWGRNDHFQSVAPAGTFTEVSTGAAHACALAADGSAECWGDNEFGQTDAPPGEFRDIAAGRRHSCGILTDSTMTCWGSNDVGQLDLPPIGYTQVSASENTCARTGGRIVCSGDADLNSAPPAADTLRVATSGPYMCSLDLEGGVSCFGGIGSHMSFPKPEGPQKMIGVGDGIACGLGLGGSLDCWGEDVRRWMFPVGNFVDLQVGGDYGCVLRSIPGELVCFNAGRESFGGGYSTVPGTFVQVSVADSSTACALRVDGSIACWSSGNDAAIAPPLGQFVEVSAGFGYACARRTDDTVTCWGNDAPRPSNERFASIVGGACGILRDGEDAFGRSAPIRCWDSSRPPEGDFISLSEGATRSERLLSHFVGGEGVYYFRHDTRCGIRADSTRVCWGELNDASLDAPMGSPQLGGSVPGMIALTPARLVDTRSGAGYETIDGLYQGLGPSGLRNELAVWGRGGVTGGAPAVLLNVVAVTPGSPGYLTFYDCASSEPPTASNVNYLAGDFATNAVLAPVDANGNVCYTALTPTDVVIDVTGYVPAVSGLTPVSPSLNGLTAVAPARLLETRPGLSTINGTGQLGQRIQGGSMTRVKVSGRGRSYGSWSVRVSLAAVLNVTAIYPEADGFVTVFRCDQPVPNASNINMRAGDVIAGLVVADLGQTGDVCVYSSVTTDLVIDVNGHYSGYLNSSRPGTISPLRILETWFGSGNTTIDGVSEGVGRLAGNSETRIQVAGRAGVPANAVAAYLNVVAIDPTEPGFLAVYPCDERPQASTVNYLPGDIVANATLAALDADGGTCIYTLTDVDVVIDVSGFETER